MASPSVSIITVKGDVHAYALDWALRDLGCHSQILEAPLSNSSSWAGPGAPFAAVTAANTRLVFRRGAPPALVDPASRPDLTLLDACNIEETRTRLERDIEAILCRRFDTLNEPAATRLAGCKILQMEEAVRAGLSLPETIVTNCADQALAFCRGHGGRIVFKPYRHNVWEVEPGKFATSRTQTVDAGMLSGADLQSPAIFQQLIGKRAEVRVCVFGQTICAVRQTPPYAAAERSVDWRREARRHDTLTEITLPDDVHQSVQALCRALNVQLTTIDLAEDETGRLWFLDFNANGQFLYVEDINPEIAMLQAFTQGVLGASIQDLTGLSTLSFKRFINEGYDAVRERCETADDMLPLRVRKTYTLTDMATA